MFKLPGTVRKSTVGLLLAVVATLVLIGINEAGHARSTAALESMAGQFETRSSLNRLLQQILDAETGSRGFLLTGDPRYLEPYNGAVAGVGKTLEGLRRAYLHTDELRVVDELSRTVQRKLAEMELSVRMRRQGNEDAWKFVLLSDVGKEHMDAIREQAARLMEGSAERIGTSEAQVRHALLISRIGIPLVALAALLAFVLYLRQTSALEHAGERQQYALQQERDQLETQVRDRTATLAELATHLQQVRE
ncbi:MAG TPA: CHASE3 domain-containing protein, partial [Longimicrobiaceae bacterium]